MCCHFADAECSFIDFQEDWMVDITKEVMGYVSKKYKDKNLTYNDYWRMKSRKVSGKQFPNGI